MVSKMICSNSSLATTYGIKLRSYSHAGQSQTELVEAKWSLRSSKTRMEGGASTVEIAALPLLVSLKLKKYFVQKRDFPTAQHTLYKDLIWIAAKLL